MSWVTVLEDLFPKRIQVLGTLLYIEPRGQRSREPIVDSLTRRMTAALSRARTGTLHGDQFQFGGGWMGWHTCACGACSSPFDHLAHGYVTNSLCVHYLAYHRHEIPAHELQRLEEVLPRRETEPTREQLEGRRV